MIRTGRTYAEAECNLTKALKERLTLTYEILTRESTLGALAEQWVDEIKREEKAIATISRYSSTIRSHVEPSAELRLYECTVPRLQRLVNGVADHSGPGAARMLIRQFFAQLAGQLRPHEPPPGIWRRMLRALGSKR